jgi:GntR family transcriptional regulator / MocR family aminotransferase
MEDFVLKHIITAYHSEAIEGGGYFKLYLSVRKVIEDGTIPREAKMPPTRKLSVDLGIARSTVVKAYDLLSENKFITATQGSGFIVVHEEIKIPAESLQDLIYPQLSESGKSFLNNIHLLSNISSEGIAFTPGLPPLDVFPIGQWQKLTNLYWRNIKSSELNYSIPSGLDSLKRCIASYLYATRNLRCTPDQVIIVSGSLQSLYLLGTVLINKGDKVCIENPTFPNVISIFKSVQAQIMPIQTDDEGIVIADLRKEEALEAKLLHTVPSNQYPLGGKMPINRRLEILQWASTHNKYIIENDYEHEINNSVDPLPSIFSLDTEQRTIYLGTFNRILHPSIRLGYMILPPKLIPAIKALQMHSHRFVPQSIQVVMTDFMDQNLMLKHINKAIVEAEDRKKVFTSYFENHFPSSIRIRKNATPSFHLIAEINEEIKDNDIVKYLEEHGLSAHSLSKCYVSESDRSGLILGYSCVNKGFMMHSLYRMAEHYTAFVVSRPS